jgi:uncharacterized membrane protein YkoI
MRWTPKLFAIALASLSLPVFSHAVEKKISKSALPPVVAKTAEEQSKGAIVRAYIQDRENGRVEYEVEMIVNGHSKDVSIGTDGGVLEVEEQVEMNALPESVQAGLKAKAGRGNITKIESLTKHGAIVAYEAQVSTRGKRLEIQVGPDGTPLDHEE